MVGKGRFFFKCELNFHVRKSMIVKASIIQFHDSAYYEFYPLLFFFPWFFLPTSVQHVNSLALLQIEIWFVCRYERNASDGKWPKNIENINSASYLCNDDGFPIRYKTCSVTDLFLCFGLLFFFLFWSELWKLSLPSLTIIISILLSVGAVIC